MAIAATDILWRYSVNTSPGNSAAQADPNASLGGYMSTSAWAGGTLHDLFDVITGDENAASEAEYRCVFIFNNHGTLTYQTPKIWLAAEAAGGANIAIGLAPQGVVAAGLASPSVQAEAIANENTAPASVTFSSPTTKATGLAPANIPAGSVIGLWIRRTAANTGAVSGDSVTLEVSGDTAA